MGLELSDVALERLHRGALLCRVTFGMTLYLPDAPSCDEILRAYLVYRKFCPPERRTLITTVRKSLFLPLAIDDIDHVRRSLQDQDRRRDEGIVIWDGNDVKPWMFWMQGWMDQRGSTKAASFCQILMPENISCEVLHSIAHDIADQLPLLSGHAGYTAQFNARLKRTAFNQIYIWAKRFLGIEVEDLNLTLPLMRDAIKGANWLTIVGSELWERLIKQHPIPFQQVPEGIVMEHLRYATLIKAGQSPTLGDRNRQDIPWLYGTVEKELEPIKVRDHPEFAGKFSDNHETGAWFQRLMTESAW